MTIDFGVLYTPDFDFDYEEVANSVIAKTLELLEFPYEAQVCVSLVSAEAIKELNSQSRGIDKVTDVLSFPLIEFDGEIDYSLIEEDESNFDFDTGEAVLGDIVICIPRLKEQAAEYGHSEKREFAFLIAHSMLHLLGYDHMTDNEEKIMFSKQDMILTALNITR